VVFEISLGRERLDVRDLLLGHPAADALGEQVEAWVALDRVAVGTALVALVVILLLGDH
jgi:hypothetical protein